MKQKSKFRRFWNLDHRKSDGFTLVELIVVIAIMAILGGVGTVGYGGYIKATNKNADKKLVGDIMRAIETGTNSMMFVNDDSFKLGKISYPVGFIALGTEGASVVTSQTEMTPPTTGACTWQTITVKSPKSEKVSHECPSDKSTKRLDCYSIVEQKITFCTAHTPKDLWPSKTSSDESYVATYKHEGTKKDAGSCMGVPTYECVGHNWTPDTYVTIPAGSDFIANADALYTASSNNNALCEAAYANQYGTFGETNVGPTTEGKLVDALKAAFGENYEEYLTLKYDGWTEEEGVSYATFYTSAPKLMEDMETLSGLLATASQIGASKLGLTQKYANGEAVLAGVSQNITTSLTEDQWLQQWNAAAGQSSTSVGFGLTGRENYSAARMAYNNAFASYCEASGENNDSYNKLIREYYAQEMLGVGLPGCVNTDAFQTGGKLEQKFKEAGDSDGSAFKRYAELYGTYKDSDACKENGKLVYDVLTTFNETSDVAQNKNNAYNGDMFDYYNSYVDEISALYKEAGTAANGGIVIVVSVQTNENGETETVFTVSPSSANPRPAK